MGQKVCPIGFRLGITENWRSRWYADKKKFGKLLVEDQKIRKYIKKNYRFTGIPKVEIERTRDEGARPAPTARMPAQAGRASRRHGPAGDPRRSRAGE